MFNSNLSSSISGWFNSTFQPEVEEKTDLSKESSTEKPSDANVTQVSFYFF